MTATANKPDRAEINRRNAQRSTGPKTPEGKDRSRFNAVKHGMAAKTLVLPGEDADALQFRIDTWTENLAPRDDVEQFLVERAVQFSWQLDRADRAEVARVSSVIRATPVEEARKQAEEAEELGRRLFWNRRGPLALYPHYPIRHQLLGERKPRTSFSGRVDDPDDPDRLLFQLESTAAGCQWLLERWTELRTRLEEGWEWQSPEKLKAIRLLGRQPIDAADDGRVATIFLACHLMGPVEPQQVDAFADLWSELLPGEEDILKQRLLDRQVDDLRPRDEDHARTVLMDLVDQVTARLKPLADAHRERSEAGAAQQADRLSFDGSVEGERLRRYQMSCGRSLLRTLDTLLKIRRADLGTASEAPAAERPDDRSSLPSETPNPVASESVAETSTRILFGPGWDEDLPPAGSDFVTTADTRIDASAWTDEPIYCAAPPDEPALATQCEPAPASSHQDSKNEPSSPDSDPQNLQNEARTTTSDGKSTYATSAARPEPSERSQDDNLGGAAIRADDGKSRSTRGANQEMGIARPGERGFPRQGRSSTEDPLEEPILARSGHDAPS